MKTRLLLIALLASFSVFGQKTDIYNIPGETKQLLVDFVATARADNWNLDITLSKFPEFDGIPTHPWETSGTGHKYCRKTLASFVQTAIKDKLNLNITVPKFPEFYYRSIPITRRGSLSYIKVEIGGVEYEFLLDTGASDVLLSNEIKNQIIRSGESINFGEMEEYVLADGSKRVFQTATLNEICIKTAPLKNILMEKTVFKKIKVAFGDDATPLLGSSFLNQYDWKIENNYLLIGPK